MYNVNYIFLFETETQAAVLSGTKAAKSITGGCLFPNGTIIGLHCGLDV